MRKSVLAVMAGLMLVAGQAAAAGNSAVVRVGDRVGAKSDTANEFAGVPLIVLAAGAVAITGAVIVLNQDDSPTSP